MEKIGHRGAKGYVAENTIASINKAIELGVDAVEIDVHKCKSGEVIVIHDETLNRTTNGKGKVKKRTFQEIQNLNAEGEKIPSLEQVLTHCAGKCKVHIELKGKGTALKTASLVETFVKEGKYDYSELVVSSFVFSRLKKIQNKNPEILLGIIAYKKPRKALRKVIKNKFSSIYCHYSKLRKPIIRLAKLKGVHIYAWTINSSKDIKQIKTKGVDGIISDFPDRL